MFNKNIYYKIFVLLFFSFFILACSQDENSLTNDDTQSTISFKQVVSDVPEGARFIYTLQLNKASAVDVAFGWAVQHHSTSTSDFTGSLTGSQLIRAGDTTATIVLDTSDDSIYEGDEIFSLNITNITGTASSALTAFGSIIDNDSQQSIPLLSFEQDYSNATEDTGFVYRLQLNKASATAVSFDWSVQHISTSNSDFTVALAGTKQIIAGSTTATIVLDTSDDNIYETDEIFTLNITNVTGASPSTIVAFGSIIDNDSQPTISFKQVASDAPEGARFIYTLQLNKASATAVSFDWSVQHHLTSTSDFTVTLAGTKQIIAGSSTATISIDTSDDGIYEGDEHFTLNIINVTGATPSNLSASGSIIDNDPQPTISFKQVASDVPEGARFIYTLQLNKASAVDVAFGWAVQHHSTSISDFTVALAGTKQIVAGSTTTTISIDTSDDGIYEGDEHFTLNIINVTGAIPSNLSASGSIIDNDPQPTISLEPVGDTVVEGTRLVYRLLLTNTSTVDVAFGWSVQHHSTSTSDFTGSLTGSQLIRAGDTTSTIVLDTSDDSIPEQAETFTLSITNITGATPSNLSMLLTILGSDVDDNGNGLIDLTTQEQLQNIRYNVAGTSYKTSASDAGVTCGSNGCRGYELLANLALITNWQPIGSASKPFTSILQGNGYSITNLAIDGGDFATDDRDYLGLFAALSGATIDNLIVEVVSITGDSNVGALVGRAVNSIINKVQIRATNTNSKLHATGANIGGILGEIIGTTITNVTSDLSIVGDNDESADNVGGIAGFVASSTISYAYSSGSVTSSGNRNDNYGGLVGEILTSTISSSSASGSVSSSGNNNLRYGGLVGYVEESTISGSSASGNVISDGDRNDRYGGLVGYVETTSTISDTSASGSVTSNGAYNFYYGGLVGYVDTTSAISGSSASGSVASSGSFNWYYGSLAGSVEADSIVSYSSASGNVTSNGSSNWYYGGLVGSVEADSIVSYSSASGSVASSGSFNWYYGGLAGSVEVDSIVSYSSASGSATSSGSNSNNYGGLVGLSVGDIRHSWSSSSVLASDAAGLVGNNGGSLGFSYALGAVPSSGFGVIAKNRVTLSGSTYIGTVAHSYWNSETSGVLVATPTAAISHTTNTASSDTAGMLGSTGFAGASVFAGFLDATDELGNNIWSFADDSYPVITALGLDKQAVALAYGLLRLAHPTPTSDLNSFLGGTLNNEVITLDAADYSANEPLAILDVNLLASNSVVCVVGSGGSIITTTGANQAVVTLSINATTSSNLLALIFDTDCSIDFDGAATISAGDRLQLAAIITKGSASLRKNFVINFR